MDRVGDLILFIRVLDRGSISAAARSLDISLTVASRRLQRLERELGVRLLHRTTRRLHPTNEGAALAAQGRALVEDLESLTSGLRDSAHEVAGTLRLTASAAFGSQYISPLLPEFLARHPRLRINVELTDHVLDLVSGGLDLAIRVGSLPDSSLVARWLAPNRRVLCASADYLRRHGNPATPDDLAHHDCLLLVGRNGRHDTWRLRDAAGAEHVVKVRGPLEGNFGELLREGALAGIGIALHSTWHVGADLAAGRLQQVLPAYTIDDSGIYAVMPQRRMVPPRVRAFVDYLAERLGGTPPWERAGGATEA